MPSSPALSMAPVTKFSPAGSSVRAWLPVHTPSMASQGTGFQNVTISYPRRLVGEDGSTEFESPTNFRSLDTSSHQYVDVSVKLPFWKRTPSSLPLPRERAGVGSLPSSGATTPRASFEWKPRPQFAYSSKFPFSA